MWNDIETVGKTVKYEVFEIGLSNGRMLRCADNHILIDQGGG